MQVALRKRICTNAGYNAHKHSHQTAQDRKNSPIGFKTAQTKKRYTQGFSTFDTAQSAAHCKHGEVIGKAALLEIIFVELLHEESRLREF